MAYVMFMIVRRGPSATRARSRCQRRESKVRPYCMTISYARSTAAGLCIVWVSMSLTCINILEGHPHELTPQPEAMSVRVGHN